MFNKLPNGHETINNQLTLKNNTPGHRRQEQCLFSWRIFTKFRPEKYDINLKQISYHIEFFRSKFGENEAFFMEKCPKFARF
jgi:hypothetical protein